MTNAEAIRKLRERLGESQPEFAPRMGIGRDMLAKWEHGTKTPTITDLGNMAQICRKSGWKELEEDFLQLQREMIAKMPAWKPTRLRGPGPTLPC